MEQSVLLGELEPAVDLEREAAATGRDHANFWALLFEAAAQQDEPALEVVADLGQPEPRIEPQLAVDERRATFVDECFRLRVRFLRAETSGPLFDTMALRIQSIASYFGMTGVFKLLSADVCEVIQFEEVDDYILPAPPAVQQIEPEGGPLTEIRALQCLSARISRATSLDELLTSTLDAFQDVFGFGHSMVLVPDGERRLVTIASRGYGESGMLRRVGTCVAIRANGAPSGAFAVVDAGGWRVRGARVEHVRDGVARRVGAGRVAPGRGGDVLGQHDEHEAEGAVNRRVQIRHEAPLVRAWHRGGEPDPMRSLRIR